MAGAMRNGKHSLLKNVIHHIGTHNRLMEESSMWKIRRKQGTGTSASDSEDIGSNRSFGGGSYGRMRSDRQQPLNNNNNRNIYKRKQEEGKWNHSGFMELYPDELLNKESMDELSSSGEDNGDRRKRKRHKNKRQKKEANEGNFKKKHIAEKKAKQLNKSPVKVKLDEWGELEACIFDLKYSPKKKHANRKLKRSLLSPKTKSGRNIESDGRRVSKDRRKKHKHKKVKSKHHPRR